MRSVPLLRENQALGKSFPRRCQVQWRFGGQALLPFGGLIEAFAQQCGELLHVGLDQSALWTDRQGIKPYAALSDISPASHAIRKSCQAALRQEDGQLTRIWFDVILRERSVVNIGNLNVVKLSIRIIFA